MKYEELQKLNELREKGAITEDEYQVEKKKILNEEHKESFSSSEKTQPIVRKPLLGLDENVYLVLMHLSQFVSGFIVPIVMWLVGKEVSTKVDEHGKNILNFQLTYVIWFVIGLVTIPIIIGIVILSVWGIAMTVFIVVAAVKASNGEYWKYPFIIHFLK